MGIRAIRRQIRRTMPLTVNRVRNYYCEDCGRVYAMFVDKRIKDRVPLAFPCFDCKGYAKHVNEEADMEFPERILDKKGATAFKLDDKVGVIPVEVK